MPVSFAPNTTASFVRRLEEAVRAVQPLLKEAEDDPRTRPWHGQALLGASGRHNATHFSGSLSPSLADLPPDASAHTRVFWTAMHQRLEADGQGVLTALEHLTTHLAAMPAYGAVNRWPSVLIQINATVAHVYLSHLHESDLRVQQGEHHYLGQRGFSCPGFAHVCQLAPLIEGLGEGPTWVFAQHPDHYQRHTVQARAPEHALAWLAMTTPSLLSPAHFGGSLWVDHPGVDGPALAETVRRWAGWFA